MVVAQGDIFWADLPAPSGSEAGFRRPVVVVQGDAFNESALRTVVCIPCTGNVRRADYPGNVLLRASSTGLARDSVASVFQITAVDRTALLERVGHVGRTDVECLLDTLDTVLGR